MTREKRRQYGSGSVYQRADGRWVGAITAGWTADGKRRRITVSATTEAACKKAVERKKAEIARNGVPAEGTAGRATVKSWADTWLTHIVHTVRPKTYSSHRFIALRLIVPTIGHRRLDLLTPGDIRSVVDACRAKDLADSTLTRARTVLLKMLRDAEAEGYAIPRGVFQTKASKPNKATRGALDPDDVQAVINTAAGLPDGSRWFMALHTGARQGEALGLTWDRVDFVRDQVDISWQLQGLDFREGKPRVPDNYEWRRLFGALCLVRPKGENRVVPMSDTLRAQLQAWRDRAPQSPHNLVWPREDGQPKHGNVDRAEWKTLQKLADTSRTYQLHELRHTAATVMLENGVDPEVIKEVLGHAAILTTMAYAHVSQTLKTQAVAALDRGYSPRTI